MSEITAASTIIQPALQQTQAVKQPDATDAARGQDPNEGGRARAIQEDAIRQQEIDKAAKREDRGQELNITV